MLLSGWNVEVAIYPAGLERGIFGSNLFEEEWAGERI